MSDTYDGDASDSTDSSNDAVDALADTTDTMDGDETSAAEAAELDAAGVEPLTDLFENEVDIAPGNLGLDTKTGPGWSVEYHGAMEVGDEVEQVTVNFKTDDLGEITDVLASPGHNAKEVHDYAPRNGHDYNHEHFTDQNTDQPNHSNRDLGLVDEDPDLPGWRDN